MNNSEPLVRVPGLHVSHRGEKTLVVEPASASWAVMPRAHYHILEQLEKPLSFQHLCAQNPSRDPGDLQRLIDRFFHHGMLIVNWKRFFPEEQVMWKPLDRAPVYPRDFYLHTTDACNFRCTYCYASAETKGRTMTLDMMKMLMERVFRDIPHESVSFVFHGGEPLLLKKTIYQAVEWAHRNAPRYGKRAFFSIQSNGSLIDDELIDHALRYGIELGVTLDGPPEVHDRCRIYPDGRGTFSDIWEATQRALRRGAHLGYLCIVHEPENYLRDYEFFVSRGIFSFNLRYSFALGRAASFEFPPEKGEKMARGLLDMIDRALVFYKRTGIRLVINDLNAIIRSLISKKRDYMCMRSPCGIGRSIIAFGPEGEIYPCEEMSPYRDLAFGSLSDRRTLTEIIDGSEMLVRLRERRVENIPRCRECPWRRFCMGRCTNKALHFYGDPMREDPSCSFFCTLFEELMWKINEDRTVLELSL